MRFSGIFLSVQIPFSALDAEALLQKVHHVVGDGVHAREVGDLHVDLGGLFCGLDQAEGLIQVLARAVNAVERPDYKPGGLHLLRRGLADLVGAAEHPGQHVHAVREDDDALGAHLPERAGKLALIERVDIGHGEQIRRVAVHDDAVFGIDRE